MVRVSGRCIVFPALVLAATTAAAAESIEFGLPVACDLGRTCFIQNYVDVDPSSSAQDYQCGTLTYDGHNGTDFRLTSMSAQRTGVDVIAAAEGRVLRARDGVPDVSVREIDKETVRGQECGNGVVIAHAENWQTQYCHLARGTLKVQPGQFVRAGQTLGRVGLSGATEYPHLHFTVRQGDKIADPFAFGGPPGTCGAGRNLWKSSSRQQLTYQERAVLNAGFATEPVTMELIEQAEAGQIPGADAPALVAFVRAIGLKAGDSQSLVVRSPAGEVIAQNRAPPLERNRAQSMLFAGKRRPSDGWDQGIYQATYVVERDGNTVLERQLELGLR